MYEEIVAAGFGGQGILRFGKILAYAAMCENRKVTYFPSYGAEVRGGTANCSVIISDDPIPSPVVSTPTAMVIMNHLSYERFVPKLKNKCLVIINSSLLDCETVPSNYSLFPFTELAVEMGNPRVANMIALGALIGKKKLVLLETIIDAIKTMFFGLRKELVELNLKALQKGVNLV